MLSTVTFFDNIGELREITGVSEDNYHQVLWDAGFNLDDWDFGFVSDTEWNEDWWSNNAPYYQFWMLDRMSSHCVGYEHVEYGGRHYYMLYHS